MASSHSRCDLKRVSALQELRVTEPHFALATASSLAQLAGFLRVQWHACANHLSRVVEGHGKHLDLLTIGVRRS